MTPLKVTGGSAMTEPASARRADTALDSGNLFAGVPSRLADELLTVLHRVEGLRIERIVSAGQRSPDGFWYDQDENEWVVVLEGRAAIQFEGQSEPVELVRGSYLNIPAHRRHRVAWTSPTEKTIWLAIHFSALAIRPRIA
jgi:cupin 2 domain-containing protein